MRKLLIIMFLIIVTLSTYVKALNITNSNNYKTLNENSKEIIELKDNYNGILNEEWYDDNGNLLPIYNVKTIYSKAITYYDKNGTPSLIEQTNIDKEEFSNENDRNTVNTSSLKASVVSCKSLDMYNDCIETNYKVLTLAFLGNPSYPDIKIAVINRWKKLPKVRSYDVIGILIERENFKMSTAYGYQYYDENNSTSLKRINYSYNGTNMKLYTDEKKHEIGVSISQNILDSAQSQLRNEIYLVGTDNPIKNTVFGATGSYQHAIYDISLDDSKNFDFSYNGMGKVFAWKKNKNYWDGMEGVCGRIDSTDYLWMC